jgi:putative FmdB family regulatory protein
MPIHEYHCDSCEHDFEALVRSASDLPRCPKCGEVEALHKQFSVPASARASGGSSSSLPMAGPSGMGGGCGMGGCGMGGGGGCGMG